MRGKGQGEERHTKAGNDLVANGVYGGLGEEFLALYSLEEPPSADWNPPTKRRGGQLVIVWAAATCGKRSTAPRTPDTGNR